MGPLAREARIDMARNGKAAPEGYTTLTANLVVKDAAKAIDFYVRALGAEERFRMAGPDGKGVQHAEIKIGDSIVMLSGECEQRGSKSPLVLGGTATSFYLYVEDVDASFKRAIKAGAQAKEPVQDMFWGDRFGKVLDPFGHEWGLATHVEDLTPAEIDERAKKFFASLATASAS